MSESHSEKTEIDLTEVVEGPKKLKRTVENKDEDGSVTSVSELNEANDSQKRKMNSTGGGSEDESEEKESENDSKRLSVKRVKLEKGNAKRPSGSSIKSEEKSKRAGKNDDMILMQILNMTPVSVTTAKILKKDPTSIWYQHLGFYKVGDVWYCKCPICVHYMVFTNTNSLSNMQRHVKEKASSKVDDPHRYVVRLIDANIPLVPESKPLGPFVKPLASSSKQDSSSSNKQHSRRFIGLSVVKLAIQNGYPLHGLSSNKSALLEFTKNLGVDIAVGRFGKGFTYRTLNNYKSQLFVATVNVLKKKVSNHKVDMGNFCLAYDSTSYPSIALEVCSLRCRFILSDWRFLDLQLGVKPFHEIESRYSEIRVWIEESLRPYGLSMNSEDDDGEDRILAINCDKGSNGVKAFQKVDEYDLCFPFGIVVDCANHNIQNAVDRAMGDNIKVTNIRSQAHEVVKWMNQSSSRGRMFKIISLTTGSYVKLKSEAKVRWNGFLSELSRLIRCREAIERMIKESSDFPYKEFDWKLMADVVGVLQILFVTSKSLQFTGSSSMAYGTLKLIKLVEHINIEKSFICPHISGSHNSPETEKASFGAEKLQFVKTKGADLSKAVTTLVNDLSLEFNHRFFCQDFNDVSPKMALVKPQNIFQNPIYATSIVLSPVLADYSSLLASFGSKKVPIGTSLIKVATEFILQQVENASSNSGINTSAASSSSSSSASENDAFFMKVSVPGSTGAADSRLENMKRDLGPMIKEITDAAAKTGKALASENKTMFDLSPEDLEKFTKDFYNVEYRSSNESWKNLRQILQQVSACQISNAGVERDFCIDQWLNSSRQKRMSEPVRFANSFLKLNEDFIPPLEEVAKTKYERVVDGHAGDMEKSTASKLISLTVKKVKENKAVAEEEKEDSSAGSDDESDSDDSLLSATNPDGKVSLSLASLLRSLKMQPLVKALAETEEVVRALELKRELDSSSDSDEEIDNEDLPENKGSASSSSSSSAPLPLKRPLKQKVLDGYLKESRINVRRNPDHNPNNE